MPWASELNALSLLFPPRVVHKGQQTLPHLGEEEYGTVVGHGRQNLVSELK